MNRRIFLKNLCFCSAASIVAPRSLFAQPKHLKPNILFIMADDLGWKDVGFNGSKFYETPNIDRLARQGMILDNAYTCGPNCAPTRASLMSGQYTPRHKILSVGRPDKAPEHLMKLLTDPIDTTLSSKTVTIAEVLKKAGYTSASMGKWHLGNDPLLGPKGQGFDYNIAGSHWGHPKRGYFSPYKMPEISNGPKGQYLTDRLTEEAIKFIDENKEKNFFLYLPYYTVHTPIQAKNELVKKYKNKTPVDQQNNPKYAAMIESLDQGIGKILDKLDQLSLSENTIVFFYSDNGGYSEVTSHKPLRGHKGQLYEGGIRVPLAVKWPGVIKPNSRCSEPVITVDFFPTLAQLADQNISLPKSQPLDGQSIIPLLTGKKKKLERNAIYWHFPCYLAEPGNKSVRQAPAAAIRKGKFKLIEFFEDNHLELYNLEEDISEKHNLADANPKKTQELHQQLINWRKSVDAKVPTRLNPKYKP